MNTISLATTPTLPARPATAQQMAPPSDGDSFVRTAARVVGVGAVTAAPSLMGAAFGWPGALAGVGVSAGIAWMASGGDSATKEILVPLATMVGVVAGAAGWLGGPIGAGVATAVGLGYGFLTR